MMRTIEEAVITISSVFVLSLIVKVTIVMVLVLGVYGLARRSRATVRHLVLAAGFVVLAAVPIAMIVSPSLQIRVPVRQWSAPEIITSSVEGRPATNHPVVARSSTAGNSSQPLSLSSVVAALWAAGAVLCLFPMVAGLWQLGRIHRFGLPWVRGGTILQELADETPIKRRIAVLVHESIPGPITCGIFRRAIVFPASAESWSEGSIRRAVVHELEHVRRRDCLTHGMARLVCAFYWFHPLVWMSWRRLGLEAERSCDDAVLSLADAPEYADQLVTLAKAITGSAKTPLLAMANRSDLGTRVAAVLDSRQRRGRPGTVFVAAVIVLSLLLTGVISPLRMSAVPAQATAPSSESQPTFEVASIKPKGPFQGPAMVGVQFLPGGLLRAENANIGLLISFAYRVSGKQLDFSKVQTQAGFLPLMNEVFDIEAKAGVNEPPSNVAVEARRHQHGLMVQTLLADRFKLVLHKETREMPMYALVVARGGSRLKPSPPGRTCPTGIRCGGLDGGPLRGLKGLDVPISALISTLTAFGDREIVDRTGIEGRFDIELPQWSRPWLPSRPNNDREREDPNDPTIFTVLRDGLGLRLEPIRGSLDVYVIDHVERPTPN